MSRAGTLAVLLCLAPACGSDGGGGGPDAAIDLTPRVATPGERCDRAERVGLVEITAGGANAFMFDKVDPMIGEPALSDAACGFHEYRPAGPCDCDTGEVCSLAGTCVAAPRRATDGRLTLRAGGAEQVFEADPELGFLGGAITLPGPAYTVEVFAFGQTVTLEAETAVPGPLANVAVTLEGTYDMPAGLDATWDPVDDDSLVFTDIPINHHAGGATFTECAVATSAGALRVEGEMLEPLAVVTGLEFQALEHGRFAAAETSRGCVEFRFSARESVGL